MLVLGAEFIERFPHVQSGLFEHGELYKNFH